MYQGSVMILQFGSAKLMLYSKENVFMLGFLLKYRSNGITYPIY